MVLYHGTTTVGLSGVDPGGRAPLFLAKSILFFTLYTMSEKFEIEF